MIKRMIGAAKLNVTLYEEVEADSSATIQAIAVVVLVSIATGIGLFGQRGVLGLIVGIPVSICLLYTSPSPRDRTRSRMPSSA